MQPAEVPQNEQELADWGNDDIDPLGFLNIITPVVTPKNAEVKV